MPSLTLSVGVATISTGRLAPMASLPSAVGVVKAIQAGAGAPVGVTRARLTPVGGGEGAAGR